MIKRYFQAVVSFPNYQNGLIYVEDETNVEVFKNYPHLFKYLHSLKRFDILCGLVGKEETYMTLNNDMYVDFHNANQKVLVTEVKDRFKNTIYRIGDLVSYTDEFGQIKTSKIVKFGIHNELDIILEDHEVIFDLGKITQINDALGFYENGTPIFETDEKLYILRYDPQKPHKTFIVIGKPNEFRYDLKNTKNRYVFNNLNEAVLKEMYLKPSLNINDVVELIDDPEIIKTLKMKALVKNNASRPNINLENLLID